MMELLGVKEACKELQCGRWTLMRLIREGELPATKVGKKWRIRKQDLEDYLARRIETETEQRRRKAAFFPA